MGWYERLKSLLPGGDGGGDIENKNINIIMGMNDHPAQQHHPGEITLDPTAADTEGELEEVKALVRELRSEGELTRQDALPDRRIAEQGVSDEEIQERAGFYKHLLSNRHYEILKSSYYLRQEWEDDEVFMSRDDMRRRRKDLVDRFGEDAMEITNLCTSGYFDEDRYFRSLYETLEAEEEDPRQKFRDMFERIIDNMPFTVFVSNSQDATSVIGEVDDRLEKFSKYGVDFVEVRGIGRANRRTIENVIEELEEQYEDIDYNRIHEDREVIIRIYPASILPDED